MQIKPLHSWREAVRVYTQPRVVSMLFLGVSAGIPLLLIFSSLSWWLIEAGIQRSTVTYFSWAGLAYSFKFVWSPLVERLPVPFLHQWLGHRRSWLLLSQLAIMASIMVIAHSDPKNAISMMAFGAVMLGFSAATQDIVIDALRIESAAKEFQAAMSAMYIAGYRVGMLLSGAGALYLASLYENGTGYHFLSWKYTYMSMSGVMLIGIVTTLLIPEPVAEARHKNLLHSNVDYLKFLILFCTVTLSFVLAFIYLNPSAEIHSLTSEYQGVHSALISFVAGFIRLLLAVSVAALVARILARSGVVNMTMVNETYIAPVIDFFQRYSRMAIWVLVLIALYRISDIVLGVISNVFYKEIGFSKEQVAKYAVTLGLFMTLAGGFLGGLLTARFGVLRILLLGAVLAAISNLLFMVLAGVGNNVTWLMIVVTADNLSAGLASAAFIAYLSSLTNISFTAVQYAIFSSLMTLLPKLIGGYSGGMVDEIGYANFFLATALMGIPSILLVLFLMYREKNGSERQS